MISLRSIIIDSYEELMSNYLESPDVKYTVREWNKMYWALREKIAPELRQEFDDLLTTNEQIWQATAEEALYTGVISGIAEHDSLFKK